MSDFVFSCLKIVSLNVRGLRDSTKIKSMFIFVRRSNANIIFFYKRLIHVKLMLNGGVLRGEIKSFVVMLLTIRQVSLFFSISLKVMF